MLIYAERFPFSRLILLTALIELEQNVFKFPSHFFYREAEESEFLRKAE